MNLFEWIILIKEIKSNQKINKGKSDKQKFILFVHLKTSEWYIMILYQNCNCYHPSELWTLYHILEKVYDCTWSKNQNNEVVFFRRFAFVILYEIHQA